MTNSAGKLGISAMLDKELIIKLMQIAAKSGITPQEYVSELARRAIEANEIIELSPEQRQQKMTPKEAAVALDQLRESLEPVGANVSELVQEGRYR